MQGPDSRRDLGAAGEAAACADLERRGYRILARNARADRVELDIVAERGGVLVFVEVKTRRGAACGSAAEAVDARKQARLARGAAAWLRASGRRAQRVRFDVITCQLEARGGLRVAHWEGASDAGGD
jgi:putative endonuclease